jgi:hypothetical protein
LKESQWQFCLCQFPGITTRLLLAVSSTEQKFGAGSVLLYKDRRKEVRFFYSKCTKD